MSTTVALRPTKEGSSVRIVGDGLGGVASSRSREDSFVRMRLVFQMVVVGQADYRMGIRDRVCYGRTCTVAKAGSLEEHLLPGVPKTVFALAEHSLTVTLQI